MKTIHMVIIVVGVLALMLGSAVYAIKAYNGFSSYAGLPKATFTINIDSDTKWSGTIGGISARSGSGPASFSTDSAMTSACFQKQTDFGYLTVTILKNGVMVTSQTTNEAYGVVAING